jgi:hypothetical protein
MSGSPVFLRDDAGRDRMIGAFAYGWPLAKDPIAGVQPIEYMLELPVDRQPTTGPSTTPATNPAGKTIAAAPVRASRRMTWSWQDAQERARITVAPDAGRSASSTSLPALQSRIGGSLPELQPLATPLMTAGLPPTAMKALAGAFAPLGLVPLQTGGSSPSGTQPSVRFEPGGVMAIPLLTGDADLTAIGTVTEVAGDRVFGFGHPFNNEGRCELPMGPGVIHGVIANLTTSFKLGSISAMRGTLTMDSNFGVGGIAGGVPAMAPIEIAVRDADSGAQRTYRFRAAVHPKFTSLLAGVALSAAAGGLSELPQYNTVSWSLDMDFANGRTVRMADRGVNVEL